jgi:hypothetical protein
MAAACALPVPPSAPSAPSAPRADERAPSPGRARRVGPRSAAVGARGRPGLHPDRALLERGPGAREARREAEQRLREAVRREKELVAKEREREAKEREREAKERDRQARAKG